jgi:hypothetical protein
MKLDQDKVFRIATDYEALREAFCDRAEDLGVPPPESFNLRNLGQMLQASGLTLVLAIDEERFAPIMAGLRSRKKAPTRKPPPAPPSRCRGNLPQRSVIVEVGPPSTSADFRGGLCYLDAVEPEPRCPALKWCPFAFVVEEHLASLSRSRREHHAIRWTTRSAGQRRMALSSTNARKARQRCRAFPFSLEREIVGLRSPFRPCRRPGACRPRAPVSSATPPPWLRL